MNPSLVAVLASLVLLLCLFERETAHCYRVVPSDFSGYDWSTADPHAAEGVAKLQIVGEAPFTVSTVMVLDVPNKAFYQTGVGALASDGEPSANWYISNGTYLATPLPSGELACYFTPTVTFDQEMQFYQTGLYLAQEVHMDTLDDRDDDTLLLYSGLPVDGSSCGHRIGCTILVRKSDSTSQSQTCTIPMRPGGYPITINSNFIYQAPVPIGSEPWATVPPLPPQCLGSTANPGPLGPFDLCNAYYPDTPSMVDVVVASDCKNHLF